MQWHWGNIGAAIGGASALVIAIAALIRSPAALRDWRARQREQAEAAREQAKAAREQAETVRLDRRRELSGWSAHGVETYGVTLITEGEELAQATRELASGQPASYVVLRVSESSYDNSNRARSLRQLIEHQGLICRPPTTGEREALETGLDAMGIPRAAYGQARPASAQQVGLG